MPKKKSKHILVVWNITEPIHILNSASTGQKDTTHLEKDNLLYIEILDYWTNLVKIFFTIPWKNHDIKWVDLMYESPIDTVQKLIDIKTQSHIWKSLNLYIREFSEEKLHKRNYIIFNKENKQIFWKIYFISSNFIQLLLKSVDFIFFLEQIKIFKNLTHNYISKDSWLYQKYLQFKSQYHNTHIIIDWIQVRFIFLDPRKSANGIVWNTNFKENIKLEIFVTEK